MLLLIIHSSCQRSWIPYDAFIQGHKLWLTIQTNHNVRLHECYSTISFFFEIYSHFSLSRSSLFYCWMWQSTPNKWWEFRLGNHRTSLWDRLDVRYERNQKKNILVGESPSGSCFITICSSKTLFAAKIVKHDLISLCYWNGSQAVNTIGHYYNQYLIFIYRKQTYDEYLRPHNFFYP